MKETMDFYYDGGGCHKTLSQLQRCIRFMPGLVVMTGATGSGRSLVLHKVVYSFEGGEASICLLSEDCPILETEEDIYKALAEGFGLDAIAEEDIEDLVERVQQFISGEVRAKKIVLIAIDDAKQHARDVLDVLLHLVAANKGLSVLLVGEPGLLEVIKQFNLQSFVMHHVALRPLLVEEVSDFVRQYLARRNIPAELMPGKKELDQLMARTGGNLSLLWREMERQVPASYTGKAARRSLPVMHWVAALAVITMTIVGYIYFPQDNETVPAVNQRPVSHDLAVPAPEPGSPVTHQESKPDNSPAVETTDGSMKQEELQPPPQESAPKMPMPVAVQPKASLAEEDLLAIPVDHYVLQVASFSEEGKAGQFLAGQDPGIRNQLHYYRRQSHGQSNWVVVYGDFPDRHTAQDAIARLPVGLKRASPWPRTIRDVQKELASHR